MLDVSTTNVAAVRRMVILAISMQVRAVMVVQMAITLYSVLVLLHLNQQVQFTGQHHDR